MVDIRCFIYCTGLSMYITGEILYDIKGYRWERQRNAMQID